MVKARRSQGRDGQECCNWRAVAATQEGLTFAIAYRMASALANPENIT